MARFATREKGEKISSLPSKRDVLYRYRYRSREKHT
jgi:hypothetical protein